MNKEHKKYALFLSGPTASGKTAFSYLLAQKISCEIVNADMGQFYQPLSVGTAKPDWRNHPIPHHLFDILSEPLDMNVCSYRNLLIKTCEDIWGQGKIPIIVGGSLFYLKSLLFPPAEAAPLVEAIELKASEIADKDLWCQLNAIDPVRAAAIHANDTYRLKRALDIWLSSGKLPSSIEPVMQPFCSFRMVFIDLPRPELFERINARAEEMIVHGSFIKEAQGLMGTGWENFLCEKKLIGYSEIFDWITRGEKKEEIGPLLASIQQKTRQYAKRQVTFWKKLRNILALCKTPANYQCHVQTLVQTDDTSVRDVAQRVSEDLKV